MLMKLTPIWYLKSSKFLKLLSFKLKTHDVPNYFVKVRLQILMFSLILIVFKCK
jgi:hypothetical protein